VTFSLDTNKHRAGLVARPWLHVAVLVAISGALRLYHLDGQLWLDEISALRGYRRPFLETITTFPPFFPNPLYELVAHASLLLLGENAFAIRLPAALFGVGGVVVLYRLARRSLGAGEALFASALLAVSYHHIFFSQDARGYTAYLFFALLATERLLELLGNMSWRAVAGYAVAIALATYSHPFGLFILAGQMLVAFFVVSYRWRIDRRDGPSQKQIVATAAMGALLILLMFAPLIVDSINYARSESVVAGHGPRMLEILPELLEGLLAAAGGWPVLILAVCLGTVGGLSWLRREPVVVWLFAAPLVVSALGILALGAGIHPRYFLLALPLGYLVGARGMMVAVRWFGERVFHAPPETSFAAQSAFGVLAVAAACIPLAGYFSVPKQDYLGALREVRELAGPEDHAVATRFAGFGYQNYYNADIAVAANLGDLRGEETRGERIWLITTLEKVLAASDPALMQYIHREYEQVRYLPGSVGDGAMRVYVRAGSAP
jgi:hypothetical protein